MDGTGLYQGVAAVPDPNAPGGDEVLRFSARVRDGKFEIKNVPAGSYEVEIWHERLGTKTANVTVGDGAANADFTMSAPKR